MSLVCSPLLVQVTNGAGGPVDGVVQALACEWWFTGLFFVAVAVTVGSTSVAPAAQFDVSAVLAGLLQTTRAETFGLAPPCV